MSSSFLCSYISLASKVLLYFISKHKWLAIDVEPVPLHTYPSGSDVFSLLIQNLNEDSFKNYSTHLSSFLDLAI